MRVLIFGKYARKVGGIESHVKLLCQGLASRGVDVTNLVSSIDSESGSYYTDGFHTVECSTQGIYNSTSLSLGMICAARRLHNFKPFDLVHLHFPDPMSHLASLAIPKTIPRVITWHSDIIRQKKLGYIYSRFFRANVKRSKAIIAATAMHFLTSRQIPSDFPNQRKCVIPFGIDYRKFQRSGDINPIVERIRANFGNDNLIIFAVGRHVEYKGFSVLLNSLAFNNCNLILGGDGPLTEDLKRQAENLGISNRVNFTGQ